MSNECGPCGDLRRTSLLFWHSASSVSLDSERTCGSAAVGADHPSGSPPTLTAQTGHSVDAQCRAAVWPEQPFVHRAASRTLEGRESGLYCRSLHPGQWLFSNGI
jgi:hypothetical protein